MGWRKGLLSESMDNGHALRLKLMREISSLSMRETCLVMKRLVFTGMACTKKAQAIWMDHLVCLRYSVERSYLTENERCYTVFNSSGRFVSIQIHSRACRELLVP